MTDPRPPLSKPRERLIGGLIGLALLALVIGGVSPWLTLGGVLGVMASLNANMAPLHLAIVLLTALVLGLLRARRTGVVLAVLAVLAGGALLTRHFGQSAPLVPEARAALKILFFNVYHSNPTDPADLAAGILAADADVVVLAEIKGLGEGRALIEAAYPHQAGCIEECGMVVFLRDKAVSSENRFATSFYRRVFAIVQPQLADGGKVTLLGTHMLKPWYDEVAALQRRRLQFYTSRIEGPLVVLGDFNAAPWSPSLAQLLVAADLKLPRHPPGSWPAHLGAFGLPIDHILVGGGARLVSLQPFGAGLGSNHRGLLAEIALPEG